MQPVLVYRRGAIIPCWETRRWYYPVVWHPTGPPRYPSFLFATDTEMYEMARDDVSQMMSRLMKDRMEAVVRAMEAQMWGTK